MESVTVEAAPSLDEPARRIKVVRAVNDGGWHICPDCGKRHQRGLLEEFVHLRFRDCSMGDFETYLETRAMRVACSGGTRVSR